MKELGPDRVKSSKVSSGRQERTQDYPSKSVSSDLLC